MTKPKSKPATKAVAKPEPKAKAELKAKVQPAATAKPKAAPRRRSAPPAPAAPKRAMRPRAIPSIDEELMIDAAPDQPFEEGAHDMISTDLRHRMISEAAYFRYTQRGYADGYDVDDWMAAEAEVDHLLLNPPPESEPTA